MRYRVTARIKWVSPLIMVALSLMFAAMLPEPWLLPLAPPLLFVLHKFASAKRTMTSAISQLTAEYGEAIGMTKALDDF